MPTSYAHRSLTSSTAFASLSIAIDYRDIHLIQPDPRNPRHHKQRQIKLLAKSIQNFGFVMPLIVNAEDHLIAGHARLEAAKTLGLTRMPVIRLEHLTPEQARALMIADNRLAELSTWDDALLATHLKELSVVDLSFDLEATSFTIGEIDLQIESLDASPKQSNDDPADQFTIAQGPAVTQPGDLWQLGTHRVFCGNALDAASYGTLMDGQKASMIITDPPYNVKVNGHVGGKGAIKHREFAMATGEMSEDEFTSFLQTVFLRLVEYSIDGSVHPIFMDWRHLPEILAAGRRAYTSQLNLCVWAKSQAGMGSLYRSQHELALVFKSGTAPHHNNVELGRFGRYRTNVWDYPSMHAMRSGEEGDLLALHPTVKPVKMISDAILDCSARGEVILDPFLGSGTTLLACERVGRLCRAIELDSLYVDTAIRRWQHLTGEEAVLASTGQSFTQREQAARQTASAASAASTASTAQGRSDG